MAPGRPPAPGTPHRVSVLVVGTDDWALEQAATTLSGAGVRVLRCHEPGAPAFPCNAMLDPERCPLSLGFDVVVTVRARPAPSVEPGEIGVVCALRTGHPLVVAGVTRHHPFADLPASVVPEGGQVLAECLAVVEPAPVT